ncbi:MAG: dihydrodipicolinate synthase family protein [Verrucomicrobia bacterium]|nr:dihydrodipicolinate synthase family protein [Verrucomicrobiota bacterium]
MNFSQLGGILPVLPTPFDDTWEVDLAAMESVTRFCLDAGASGLVFPGVASEYDHLSSQEQVDLLKVVCRVADGRAPVICGGGKGEPEVIAANIRNAQELGVVAAMVLIPNRFAGDEEGALKFILSVISHAPGVEIVLQNAPAPVGAGMSSSALIRIVKASTAIRYVKEEALPSGPRITAQKDAAPPHLQGVIGGGGARYLIDEMKRGAIGAMPAAEIADLHVRMWDAYQKGDESEARELYRRTLPLLIIQLLYRMRLTKYVLTARGIFSNSLVRAPLPDFDAFDEVELQAQMDSLNELFEMAPVRKVEA